MDLILYGGRSQLELEHLGLFKIDFMQGNMVRGEEDQNMTICLVFVFWDGESIKCYVRLTSDSTEVYEQGFDLTTLSSYFQGQN